MSLRKHIDRAGRALVSTDHRARRLADRYAAGARGAALDGFSKLGDQPQLRAAAAALIAAGVFGRSDRLTRAGARMIIAHEAATLVKDLVKRHIDRTRPRSASSRGATRPRKGTHRAKEKTSFPSGHTAGAIAAARAISREYPAAGAVALGAAGLIAATQILRRAHYASDVAAGVAIGLIGEATVNAAWKAARMDQRSTGAEEKRG